MSPLPTHLVPHEGEILPWSTTLISLLEPEIRARLLAPMGDLLRVVDLTGLRLCSFSKIMNDLSRRRFVQSRLENHLIRCQVLDMQCRNKLATVEIDINLIVAILAVGRPITMVI